MGNSSEADGFGGFQDELQDTWWSALHNFLQPKLRLKQKRLLGYNSELPYLQLTLKLPTSSARQTQGG